MTIREYILALEALAAQYGDDTPVCCSGVYGEEEVEAPYYQPSDCELQWEEEFKDVRFDCVMVG